MADDPAVTPDPQPDPAPAPEPAPWGDDANFDAEKAKKLIENLREDVKRKTSPEIEKLRKQIDALKPLADRAKALEDEKKSDVERLTEQISGMQASLREAQVQAVRGEIKSLAGKDFADPEDAAAFLDAGKYLTDSGEYDDAAIRKDLADLLKRKPHLGREHGAGPRPPAPDPTQGSSGNTPVPRDPKAIFEAFMQRQLGHRAS